MVPINQPLPIQQAQPYAQQIDQFGVPGPTPPYEPYSMRFNYDNWTYFGQTGFPSSAGTYRGQMPPWRALAYVNSLAGNNAGAPGMMTPVRPANRQYVGIRRNSQ
jgi:hypothetical protein